MSSSKNPPTLQELSGQPERAREIAWLILQRHRQLGTIKKLASLRHARQKKRKDDDEIQAKSDSGESSFLLLFSMAVYFGVCEPHVPGLMVYASREEIADSIGIRPRSTYRPTRDLVAVGALHIIRAGGSRPDCFELLVPAVPGDPLEATGAPVDPPPNPPDGPIDAIRRDLHAFNTHQRKVLLSILVRIEELEARKGGA